MSKKQKKSKIAQRAKLVEQVRRDRTFERIITEARSILDDPTAWMEGGD
jgi:hypothetical protein